MKGNLENAAATDPSDAMLLVASGEGDREAFRVLYRRLEKPLYSMAYRFAGNQVDAEELMQEAFLELWTIAPKYDAGRSSPLTFASRILRSRAIDRFRKNARRQRIVGESAPDILDSTQGNSTQGVFEKMRHGELAKAVQSAFAILTKEQQVTLQLAYFGGLSQSEIAEQQSEPLGTVKSRIRRGLEKLRTELEGKL